MFITLFINRNIYRSMFMSFVRPYNIIEYALKVCPPNISVYKILQLCLTSL